jgi:serine/threonine protein kinase
MREWKLGAYQLVKRLGEGGMAQVYLARDVRLGREVAVKVLDRRLADRSGFRDRFLREARVAAALDHPNIVPLYDFGEETGVLYLVMPYVSGGSLQEQLTRTPLEMSEVVNYGSQLTDALAYAHQRHLVHRDVKPANILIHADGRLMLSDFGLAKILDSGLQPVAARNHPDAGTPEYMAPEQIEGRTEARSDIYGLGVVLYLLMTGRLPFGGSSSNAVMEAHLYRLPESPRRLNPHVTSALELVVMQSLAKRPEDRFATASEMGAALMAALVAGDAAPLPFENPISPLPYASLPPISRAGSQSPMPRRTSGGSEYPANSHATGPHVIAPGQVYGTPASASPLPELPPSPSGFGAPVSAPTIQTSGAHGNSSSSGRKQYPSDIGTMPMGISGPYGLSLPTEQVPTAPVSPATPLTYRAGEVARLNVSQPTGSFARQQHSLSQPPSFGVKAPTTRPVSLESLTIAASSNQRKGGSRLWIVWVAILAVLLVAAIVLLRMAQTGTLFSL